MSNNELGLATFLKDNPPPIVKVNMTKLQSKIKTKGHWLVT